MTWCNSRQPPLASLPCSEQTLKLYLARTAKSAQSFSVMKTISVFIRQAHAILSLRLRRPPRRTKPAPRTRFRSQTPAPTACSNNRTTAKHTPTIPPLALNPTHTQPPTPKLRSIALSATARGTSPVIANSHNKPSGLGPCVLYPGPLTGLQAQRRSAQCP